MSTVFLTAWLVLASAAAELAQAQETSDYARAMAQWYAEREESLKSPDGWLNLAGLYWLDPGVTRIGSAPDNFKHKGLAELFESGRSRGIRPDLHARCVRRLEVL